MLTEQYLNNLSDQLVELYSTLEYEIKRDMVKRLAKLQKITDATEWSAKILNEAGGLRSNINKYVEQYDTKAQSMIKKLFYEALQKNEAQDLKNVSAAKRNLNANQLQMLNAKLKTLEQAETVTNPKDATIDKLYSAFFKKYQYDDTFKAIKRMTMTIADTSQEEFIRECNNAYMKVSSGAYSYQQALKEGVDELATTPVKTVFYSQSGSLREFSIESALRMNILTGVNQVASQQTLDNAEDIGVDQYEVSAHIGARWSKYAQNPWSNHSEWQGKIYTKEELTTVCGLGEPDGLCGINCRHSFYPYIKGMPKLYSKEALEEMNNKTVSLYGKQVSQYEAEQELRKTERAIRVCKRKAGCEEAAGLDNTKARVKLGELQQKARVICNETGIKRDYSREYVGTKTGDQPRSLLSLVDKNYFSRNDPLRLNVENVKKDGNFYDIGGHGTSNSITVGGKNMSAFEYAQLIKKDPSFNRDNGVRLLSCCTGQGSKSFAQQLANELDCNVKAPNDVLYIDLNGNLQIGLDNSGEFILFKPWGKK